MIKFFRTIRKNLIEQDKVRKYLVYAIGEIILVVIGILIALAINDWNEQKKNQKKEMVFLINFQQDLKSDLEKLDSLKLVFETAANSKTVFESVFNNKEHSNMSLAIHFKNQYGTSKDFSPNTITISELKNSSGINSISNPQLRRQLVSLYNTYDNLATKLNLGTEKLIQMVNYCSPHFNNVLFPTDKEIQSILEDNYFKNQIRANYIKTQLEAVNKAQENCELTLSLIGQELHD